MSPDTCAAILAQINAGPDHDWAAETLLEAAVKRGEDGAKFALTLWQKKQMRRLIPYLREGLVAANDEVA